MPAKFMFASWASHVRASSRFFNQNVTSRAILKVRVDFSNPLGVIRNSWKLNFDIPIKSKFVFPFLSTIAFKLVRAVYKSEILELYSLTFRTLNIISLDKHFTQSVFKIRFAISKNPNHIVLLEFILTICLWTSEHKLLILPCLIIELLKKPIWETIMAELTLTI